MRLEDVTAEIRPRSDWEAVDLGFAMVRRDFWRCLGAWWLAMALPTVLGVLFLRDHPFVVIALLWWLRPAGSRLVLFLLSRRLFGAKPTFRQMLRELPKAWWRRFFYRFVWARFSPWSPVVMPVEDLEGLRGKLYYTRSKLLLRRGDSQAFWLSVGSSFGSIWLALSLMAMIQMLLPQGQSDMFVRAWEAINAEAPEAIPVSLWWLLAGCYLLSLSCCDALATGGGFGIYVNNRTWIEGWDVELTFKRLAARLVKPLALLTLLFAFVPGQSQAVERAPAELIQEVKAHPDFEVHTRKIKKPEDRSPSSSSSSGGTIPDFATALFSVLGYVALVVAAAVLVAGIVMMLKRYRATPAVPSLPGSKAQARVVMGMAVTRDSLPTEIPQAAWQLWNEGRAHEAIALLYRGAISRVMEMARVEIIESDTEGDCLRRVKHATSQAHPDYFEELTSCWVALAYAKTLPLTSEVEALCRNWPYVERRAA